MGHHHSLKGYFLFILKTEDQTIQGAFTSFLFLCPRKGSGEKKENTKKKRDSFFTARRQKKREAGLAWAGRLFLLRSQSSFVKIIVRIPPNAKFFKVLQQRRRPSWLLQKFFVSDRAFPLIRKESCGLHLLPVFCGPKMDKNSYPHLLALQQVRSDSHRAVISIPGHTSFALWLAKQRNGPGDQGAISLLCLRMAWQWAWQSRKAAESADGDDGCACMFMDSCSRASHSSTHFFQSEKVVVNMWVLCTAFKISSPVQVREMPRALSLSQRSLGPIQYQQARRYS